MLRRSGGTSPGYSSKGNERKQDSTDSVSDSPTPCPAAGKTAAPELNAAENAGQAAE